MTDSMDKFLPPIARSASRMHSVTSAAAILGLSPTTLYDLLRKGEIDELGARKIGRQWRISQARLDQYLGVAS
jgi:excisionase family DNA binding protein